MVFFAANMITRLCSGEFVRPRNTMETADPFRTPLIGWVRVIFRNRASYRQVAVAAL